MKYYDWNTTEIQTSHAFLVVNGLIHEQMQKIQTDWSLKKYIFNAIIVSAVFRRVDILI